MQIRHFFSAVLETDPTEFWGSVEFRDWGTFRGVGGMTLAVETGFLGETCYLVDTQTHYHWNESIYDWLMLRSVGH